MFPTASKHKLAQRALGAVRVARSFLLLEDDYEVDWEVGQDEPATPSIRTERRCAEGARAGARGRPGACAAVPLARRAGGADAAAIGRSLRAERVSTHT